MLEVCVVVLGDERVLDRACGNNPDSRGGQLQIEERNTMGVLGTLEGTFIGLVMSGVVSAYLTPRGNILTYCMEQGPS